MKDNRYNKTIYFNNAATSYPKPKEIIIAVKSVLNSIPSEYLRDNISQQNKNVIDETRILISKLFNISEYNRIIFTQNATESLNLAIKGLAKKYTGNLHILTTNTEHNSVLRPLHYLKKEELLYFDIFNCDEFGDININKFFEAVKPETKMIIVNHCSNVTGKIIDIKKIGKYCRKNNIIFLVDASQSAGNIPIDVEKQKIDILCWTGHKSLFAPQSIGGIYISENVDLPPLKVGGTGVFSNLLYQPEKPFYLKYEAGTYNLIPIAGLNAGLKFIKNTGLKQIYETKHKLLNYLISKIKDINNIIIYGDIDYTNREAIISFNLKNWDTEDVGYILSKSYNIICRTGLHCAPLIHKSLGTAKHGTVRISLSYFNTYRELDILINALKKMAG